MPYFDHAATTPPDPDVVAYYLERLVEPLNPSSVHRAGQNARTRLESARVKLASLLGTAPTDVVFTASASEANNMAIRGLARREAIAGRKLTVYTSELEHACIRETTRLLAESNELNAYALTVLSTGQAEVPNQSLLSGHKLLNLMAIQNETGIYQRLAEARTLREQEPSLRWLCDITQAFSIADARTWRGADFLSLSSHKIAAPAGAGALAGPGVPDLIPILTGGPQEGEHRAGTQAVALIEAFVYAAQKVAANRGNLVRHLDSMTGLLMTRIGEAKVSHDLNGELNFRASGFLNLSISGLSGADMVIALDAAGFCVSSGSACATGVMERSPALAAMFPEDHIRAAGAVRLTMGRTTMADEVERLAAAIISIVDGQRRRVPKRTV